MKINKCGLIVGRFQHIHKGHEKIINIGLEKCNRLLILVSDDEVNFDKNPYDANYRASLIERIYLNEVLSGRIVIKVLNTPDYIEKYVPLWGKYLLELGESILGEKIDTIVYGDDKNILKCFSKQDLINIDDIKVKRSELDISATNVGEYLLNDKKDMWLNCVNDKIINEYDILRKGLKY